jgi:hypothetical protein
MEGVITAYSGTSLTINVDMISGSGTFALWTITMGGQPTEISLGAKALQGTSISWTGLNGSVDAEYRLRGSCSVIPFNASSAPYLFFEFNEDEVYPHYIYTRFIDYNGVHSIATAVTDSAGAFILATAPAVNHTLQIKYDITMRVASYAVTQVLGTVTYHDWSSGLVGTGQIGGIWNSAANVTSIYLKAGGASTTSILNGLLTTPVIKPP